MFKTIITAIFGGWQGWAALAVAITLIVGSAELYVYGRGDAHGAARVQGLWDADKAAQVKSANAAELVATQKSVALNQQNLELQKRLDNEITKNNIYRTCIVPADGVRLYNKNR